MQVSKYDWSGERTRHHRLRTWLMRVVVGVGVMGIATVVGYQVLALA
ncbi:hypothetical protein [Mesorhizobium sp. CAU 1741]